MEFKLNKIDTDIINKIKESTRDKKVQQNNNTDTQKNVKDNLSEENKYQKYNDFDDNRKKKYLTIDGVKYNKKEIQILAEKNESISFDKLKGHVLDIKK